MSTSGVYCRNDQSVAFDDDWRDDRRACLGMDTNLFYPDRNAPSSIAVARRIQEQVCTRCPVQKECLAEALANREYGSWGGVAEVDREQMLKAQRHNRGIA